MSQIVMDLSDELAAELAANDQPAVDPRTIPCRFSLLKTMSLSPAHYWQACQQPQDHSLAARLGAFATDRKEALRLGTAIHAMLLGEDATIGRFPGRRAGKAWDAAQAEMAGRGCIEILNDREWFLATEVVTAIRNRDDAMRLLFDGTRVEQRIDWEWMNRSIRSTPDARSRTHVVDLKSAISSEPETFRRQALRLAYHAQAELYHRAIVAAGEPEVADHFVIAVEKTRPHPVTIFRFTAEMLELGARMNRRWMERLQQCELANVWPEYAPCGVVIDLDVEEEWAA